MAKVLLRDLAYTRSGDKGDISNVGIVAFNKENYEILKKQVTPERVKKLYGDLVKGEVKIYPMNNISSLEVVMYRALGGGATTTLRWDETGKSMCLGMHYLEIELPKGFKPSPPPM